MTADQQQEGSDADSEIELSEPHSVPLGKFIDDNSNLFIVMGVFAAFAVYIARIPIGDVDEQYVRLGLVSSFIAAGIIWVLIIINLLGELGDNGNPFRNFFSPANIDVGLFFIVFNVLFYSLFQIVLQEPREVAFIAYLATIGGVILIWMTGTWKIGELMYNYYPHHEFCLALSSLFVASIVYYLLGIISADIAKEATVMDFAEMTDANFADLFPSVMYHSFIFLEEIIPIAIIVSMFMILAYIEQVIRDLADWIDKQSSKFNRE